MRFINLHMENFRATRELEIAFEPDLTVIVGRNGVGKTSILDILAQFMRLLRSHVPGPNQGTIINLVSDKDIRIGAESCKLRLEFSLKYLNPKMIDQDIISIVHSKNFNKTIFDHSNKFAQWSQNTKIQTRFIHYPQVRGFQSEKYLPNQDSSQTFDPEAVQDMSLNGDLRAITDLENWWDRRDAEEARRVRDGDRSYRDPQLQAIRRLTKKIDSFSGISFSSTSSPPGLHFLKKDRTPVHVSSLSGGERSYIILLADLARRLQVFAPEKPLGEIPAIVLIDEIELNLHPAWQSEIATTLTGIFSACQFIVTTHSPQVLSGVESRHVRTLEEQPSGATKVSIPLSTRGRTSNYLLEGVFGASERYPPIERLIDDFNRAIDKGDGATAAGMLARIEEEIEEDAPTLLVLRKRLKTLQGGE